jgi:hypothetical protein
MDARLYFRGNGGGRWKVPQEAIKLILSCGAAEHCKSPPPKHTSYSKQESSLSAIMVILEESSKNSSEMETDDPPPSSWETAAGGRERGVEEENTTQLNENIDGSRTKNNHDEDDFFDNDEEEEQDQENINDKLVEAWHKYHKYNAGEQWHTHIRVGRVPLHDFKYFYNDSMFIFNRALELYNRRRQSLNTHGQHTVLIMCGHETPFKNARSRRNPVTRANAENPRMQEIPNG